MWSFTKSGDLFSQSLSPRASRWNSRASLGLESLEERQLMSTLFFVHGNSHQGK
jgi:hypothetical protein